MYIANYTDKTSHIDLYDEALTWYPYTLLVDNMFLACRLSYEIICYRRYEEWNDEFIISKVFYHFDKNQPSILKLKDFWEEHEFVMKLIRKKAKSSLHCFESML